MVSLPMQTVLSLTTPHTNQRENEMSKVWSWKDVKPTAGKAKVGNKKIVKQAAKSAVLTKEASVKVGVGEDAGEVKTSKLPKVVITSPTPLLSLTAEQDGAVQVMQTTVDIAPSTPKPRKRKVASVEGGGVGDDLHGNDTHLSFYPTNTKNSPQQCDDGEDVQAANAIHPVCSPLSETITKLVVLQRHRKRMIQMQSKINNMASSYMRLDMGWSPDLNKQESDAIKTKALKYLKRIEKGDYPEEIPLPTILGVQADAQSRSAFDKLRDDSEKEMRQLARQLPVNGWATKIKGFADLGLAIIVAEAGAPLSEYSNPAKLWKRLGLAVMSDGRQRRVSDATSAAEHGYNPQRRSQVWAIIDSMSKHQLAGRDEDGNFKRDPGPYGAVYYAKRAEYDERVVRTDNLTFKDPEKWTPKRAHSAALRFMTKKLVKDMWIEWRHAV